MFSIKLKEYREGLGLTQEEMSIATGISRSIISMLEANMRPPSKKVMQKLVDYSHKPKEWWLEDEPEREYKDLEALNILLDVMVDKGMFGSNGEISDKDMQKIKRMLEAEIRIKMDRKNKSSAD